MLRLGRTRNIDNARELAGDVVKGSRSAGVPYLQATRRASSTLTARGGYCTERRCRLRIDEGRWQFRANDDVTR